MDTDVLRWFQQVADGTTVTEVALAHRISQPAVSRALARLEKDAGAPLLRRSGRVLRLTRAGVEFKRHLDSMMHSLDDALAAVDQVADPETGTVAVAFQPSLGTWLVPELIASFRADHPGVRFELVRSLGDTDDDSPVSTGRVDLELTSRRWHGPDLLGERLLREPLLLAVPPGHRLASDRVDAAEIWLTETAGEPFIGLGLSRSMPELIEKLCSAAGFSPETAFEVDDLDVLHAFVRAGLGVAVVPAAGREPGLQSDGVSLLHIADPGAVRDVVILRTRDERLLPAAQLFHDHVLAASGWR